MPKKIFLLSSLLFIALNFAGCAKYTPSYHSFKYYSKHKKQALKVYDFCDKNYPGWQNQEPENRAAAKRLANCANAKSGYWIQNIFKPPRPLHLKNNF